MNRSFVFYDTYERHKKVAELIGRANSVLDISGQLDALSQFCDAKKIVVTNLKSSQEKKDIAVKVGKLPFKDNSFDVVCSIDVLEHIEAKKRKDFIIDALRVADKKIIMSFPIGTSKHINYEIDLTKNLERKGIDVTYLKEHVRYKLPTRQDIEEICKGLRYKIDYSGFLPVNSFLFKVFLFDPQIKFVRRIAYFLKLLFNSVTNDLFYLFLSHKQYSENVNRAYLEIIKNE